MGLFGARALRPGSVDRLDTCRVPSEFGRVDGGGDSSVRRPEFGACLLCGGKLAGDVCIFPAAHEVFNVRRHPAFRFAWEDARSSLNASVPGMHVPVVVVAVVVRCLVPRFVSHSFDCLDLQAYLHVQWLRFQHVSTYSLRKTSGNTKD